MWMACVTCHPDIVAKRTLSLRHRVYQSCNQIKPRIASSSGITNFQVGVEVLGWVGVVLNCLAFVGGMARHSPTSGEIAIIGIFIYASLIVAKRTGRHKWYLPFLFVNVSLQ